MMAPANAPRVKLLGFLLVAALLRCSSRASPVVAPPREGTRMGERRLDALAIAGDFGCGAAPRVAVDAPPASPPCEGLGVVVAAPAEAAYACAAPQSPPCTAAPCEAPSTNLDACSPPDVPLAVTNCGDQSIAVVEIASASGYTHRYADSTIFPHCDWQAPGGVRVVGPDGARVDIRIVIRTANHEETFVKQVRISRHDPRLR